MNERITIDTIIEKLCPIEVLEDKIKEKVKPLEYGEKEFASSFPKRLRKFFNKKKIYRKGVTTTQTKNNSLYMSILTLLKPDFDKATNEDQIVMIDTLKSRLISLLKSVEWKDIFDKEYKTLGWKKRELISDIQRSEGSEIVFKFLSDQLYINIFLLDFEENQLYLFFNDANFIKHKKNIIVCRVDNSYEPILSTSHKGFWNHEMKELEKILKRTHRIFCPTVNLIKDQPEDKELIIHEFTNIKSR
jgi:hypothetical protein